MLKLHLITLIEPLKLAITTLKLKPSINFLVFLF